ncbi:tetratricopeptide repeat protein [Thalassobaculum salexigens]|uniref:tetratricopeptide repeat protein n=1 Tax=Thalassobaculum salexigens TaxID=455360 RepID=UPI00248D95D8|nr:tetratricopeptide repeat protein [Thalassobaculum salexigens]
MRQFAIITAFVVVVALALSFLLLPSQKELGTMLLRDREYEESRRYFEEQIAAGDRSPQVVTGLLEIYIRNGDVDRAIALVGSYEEAIGTGPDILRRLAELYRQDRRFGLYLQTLERLTAIEPTAERIGDLADAYYKAGRTEKQVSALKWLRSTGSATVDRQVELAELQIATGAYEAAADSLTRLLDASPDALSASYKLQLFDLALHLGDRDRAVHVADRTLTPDAPGSLAVSFADTALYRHAPELGLRLLHAHRELEASDPDWRRLHANGLRAVGRDDEAWAELKGWWQEDMLPPASAGSLVELAIRRAELTLALDAFSHFGLEQVGSEIALSLVGELHRAGRADAVDAMLATLGPDALDADPILGAEIMMGRGDMAAAGRFADLALARSTATMGERLALASVLARLERADEAFDLLHPYIAEPALPVEGALLLAELYVRLDRAEDGFWDVAALLAQRSSPRLRAIWAQLALATGRTTLVAEWLEREPTLDPRTATDIYFLAEGRQAWDAAVPAARRLTALEPGNESAQRLAYALFQNGEAEAALDALRPLIPDNPDAEPLYADILGALGRTDELVDLWTRQMGRPGLSDEDREGLVYNLLQVGADAAAWDQLLALVESQGGGWWYTAAAAAKRLGRVEAFAEVARSSLQDVDPASEEATAIVYAVADADRDASVPLFRSLAERAPAQWDPAYMGVLRDLGRRQELIAWTTDRLAQTRDPETALSLAYGLAEMDPAAAAKAVAPRAESSRAFADLYADLLRRAGQRDKALAFELALAQSGRFGADYTREAAFRALESGDRATAERLFRRVAADAPPDSDSVRQLFYLWGPRPRPEALDWIEDRARRATGEDRDAWLDTLIEMRAGKRVAAIIGGLDGATTDRELLHLVNAYAQIDDRQGESRQKLRDAMLQAIARIKQPERLRSLARIAENTRDRALITAAWRAVLAAAPADPEAQRTLGLIAYDEGRLIDAERLLGAYLANGEGDYEANYYYADTLARTDRTAQAMPFYRRAHAQLTQIEPRDFTQEVARANLLRRLGRTAEAVALMDKLVRQRPEDEGLRADFADLLIESGDLRRARSILKLK